MIDLEPYLTDEVRDKFWSRVDPPDATGCMNWNAGKTPAGYGSFHIPGLGNRGAHRIAYWLKVKPLCTGEVIDHLCRNTSCVNPLHMEAVSSRENTLRGKAGEHRRLERLEVTHCTKGHPLVPGNLKPRKDNARECLTCRREWNRNYKRKQRAAALRAIAEGDSHG